MNRTQKLNQIFLQQTHQKITQNFWTELVASSIIIDKTLYAFIGHQTDIISIVYPFISNGLSTKTFKHLKLMQYHEH